MEGFQFSKFHEKAKHDKCNPKEGFEPDIQGKKFVKLLKNWLDINPGYFFKDK